MRQPVEHEVGADESGAAGYENGQGYAALADKVLILGHAFTDASEGAKVFQRRSNKRI